MLSCRGSLLGLGPGSGAAADDEPRHRPRACLRGRRQASPERERASFFRTISSRSSRRAAMGLDALPDSLLDFVVELAGWNHGWRLEVASPALRATSAVCVARRLGTCRWFQANSSGTGMHATAEFQPRWRHCAAAKLCGPYLLLPGWRSDDDRYVQFSGFPTVIQGANYSWSLSFVARGDAERFMIERERNSTRGRILSHTNRGCVLSFNPGTWSTYSDDSFIMRCSHHNTMRIKMDNRDVALNHSRTQWMLNLQSRSSQRAFTHAKNPCSDEFRRALGCYVSQKSEVGMALPHTVRFWKLVPATLPESEMCFQFEHPQLQCQQV